ncbi:hypothetical protein [Pseudomonas leptonychotis]|uniref:hypothetical protein n=1 Tax=Pseudomonas leptonychotis TaxID=2448482 RepID=UPI003863AC00
MALPTAENVTSMYLYGSLNTPGDLLDPSLLNHRASTSPNAIDVSAVDYMATGAGRFVNSANFKVVSQFFEDFGLPPGVYTKSQIFLHFGYIDSAGKGLLPAGYTINQIYLGTDDADYAERAYIWGTTPFNRGLLMYLLLIINYFAQINISPPKRGYCSGCVFDWL